MSEHYLWLTPILTFLVVSLVGFVGCHLLFGLEKIKYGPARNLVAEPGDLEVRLSWDPPLPSQDQPDSYRVKRGTSSGQYPITQDVGNVTSFTDTNGIVNGTPYFYKVTSLFGGEEHGTSNEATATPRMNAVESFITQFNPGTPRNDFAGWVGMVVRIGPNPVMARTLGRAFSSGNSATHDLKIVRQSDGTDVDGSLVSLTMSPGNPGEFQYAVLPGAVPLDANTTYYIVSHETIGGDFFLDNNTQVQTTNIGAAIAVVYQDDFQAYNEVNIPNRCYGPVDFQYF